MLDPTAQPQVHIRHLIVHRRLIDEIELFILARQFPNVRYLELALPLKRSVFRRCLIILFRETAEKRGQRLYWPDLVCFSTKYTYEQMDDTDFDSHMYMWLLQNTHLKLRPSEFFFSKSNSTLCIWL
jgi:hypothetical protein